MHFTYATTIEMFFDGKNPKMVVQIWSYMIQTCVSPIDESASGLLIELCNLVGFLVFKRFVEGMELGYGMRLGKQFCQELIDFGNHILLHCIVVRVLWEIVLALFGAHWVFPETVKEVLLSWRGPFVGKKRKKIWNSIPLCIFWTVWKERNRSAFRGDSLAIQKLKNSFVCNLWSWARVYMGEESSSLLGFLEWLAVP